MGEEKNHPLKKRELGTWEGREEEILPGTFVVRLGGGGRTPYENIHICIRYDTHLHALDLNV